MLKFAIQRAAGLLGTSSVHLLLQHVHCRLHGCLVPAQAQAELWLHPTAGAAQTGRFFDPPADPPVCSAGSHSCKPGRATGNPRPMSRAGTAVHQRHQLHTGMAAHQAAAHLLNASACRSDKLWPDCLMTCFSSSYSFGVMRCTSACEPRGRDWTDAQKQWPRAEVAEHLQRGRLARSRCKPVA